MDALLFAARQHQVKEQLQVVGPVIMVPFVVVSTTKQKKKRSTMHKQDYQ